MNKIRNKYFLIGLLGVFLFSCSDWTTPENIQFQNLENGSSDFVKSEEYFENLRAYRKSDHKLLFGWFGYWTGGNGASARGSLDNAPDSMDIFSVFGKNMYNLTPLQIQDMRYAQEVKGQKIVFTFMMQNVGFGFPQTPEGVIQYAHALCDTVRKYGYDGIDLDYEPNYGGAGYFSDKDEVHRFVSELGKELGPKSGTDKILILDGEVTSIHKETVPYFNLAVSQCYAKNNFSSLDSRLNSAVKFGWRPEQFLVAEEFQLYGSTGGVSFTLPSGEEVPSMLGMAYWAADRDAGGCGAYHIEFDYNNYPCYKYTRDAIRIMNTEQQ